MLLKNVRWAVLAVLVGVGGALPGTEHFHPPKSLCYNHREPGRSNPFLPPA